MLFNKLHVQITQLLIKMPNNKVIIFYYFINMERTIDALLSMSVTTGSTPATTTSPSQDDPVIPPEEPPFVLSLTSIFSYPYPIFSAL